MMRKNRIVPIVIFLMAMALPQHSKAWGLLGHRIVGQIADSYLTKKARKSITAILGNESVAMCSNWADFVKSDSSYDYLGPWHYVNFVSGLSKDDVYAYLHNDSLVNAYTKGQWLIGQLKDRSLPLPTQQMYLRLLIHIIGDIHQPLHAGRLSDRGGNGIKVQWFRENKNLHQVWDEMLIDFQQLSYTEYASAINHATPEERKQMQQSPMEEWIWESYQHAEGIYAFIKTPDQRLNWDYNFKYKAILEHQLLNGGIRLAAVLNEIYK